MSCLYFQSFGLLEVLIWCLCWCYIMISGVHYSMMQNLYVLKTLCLLQYTRDAPWMSYYSCSVLIILICNEISAYFYCLGDLDLGLLQ